MQDRAVSIQDHQYREAKAPGITQSSADLLGQFVSTRFEIDMDIHEIVIHNLINIRILTYELCKQYTPATPVATQLTYHKPIRLLSHLDSLVNLSERINRFIIDPFLSKSTYEDPHREHHNHKSFHIHIFFFLVKRGYIRKMGFTKNPIIF